MPDVNSKPLRTALRRLRAAWLVLRHGDEQERRERERQAEERRRAKALADEFRKAYERVASRTPIALDGTPIEVGKLDLRGYWPNGTYVAVSMATRGGTSTGGVAIMPSEEPTS